MLLQTLKYWVKKLPIAFTQNQRYDKQTKEIIKRVVGANSVCIDIGCHKGEILDEILAQAPESIHFAFEPIPSLYKNLVEKYAHTNAQIVDIALSNEIGERTFNYVVSNPSYSGLQKRAYDRKNEKDEVIVVQVNKLDNKIPVGQKIDFIKIDVEGGEMQVLQGGEQLIRRYHPIILFEHGLGASEFYGTNPTQLYDWMQTVNMQINTMDAWLKHQPALTKTAFEALFYNRIHYYFIAYPYDI